MSNNKDPKKYSREDLERYLQGKMSASEMHQLEKDAMDDEFLAEALEGLMDFSGPARLSDLQALDQRLADRINTGLGSETDLRKTTGAEYEEQTPVIPITEHQSRRKTKDSRLRTASIAAALLILISLAGVTTWVINRNSGMDNRIAQTKTSEPAAASDSVQPIAPISDAASSEPETELKADSLILKPSAAKAAGPSKKTSDGKPASTQIAVEAETPAPIASDDRVLQAQTANAEKSSRRVSPAGTTEKTSGTYVFTGQVTDAGKKPLSFVNLQIRNSGLNTYTDARGFYRIMSADSVVQLELKSVGYQSRDADLRASSPHQLLAMQSASNSGKVQGANPRASSKEEKSRIEDASPRMDEGKPAAEPTDGWPAYQSYLLNNLRMPVDAVNQKLHGTVEISFMVSEQGRRSDYRLEKSLSPSCDREAIRLLKEGPAWMLYNSEKPVRAKLTIVF